MKFKAIIASSVCASLLALTAHAADKIDLKDVKCVMNPKAAAKATKSVKYKSGKVFFCCDNCPKAFASKVKEDKLVAAKGNHQLIATKQVKQHACPFSGGPAKAETAIKVAGASIAFCCENCQGKAKGMEGKDQILALFGDDAFKKAGFKLAKATFTSEGASDPEKRAAESDNETTSEGASDPEARAKEEDNETTSEGANDPEARAKEEDNETKSEGADDPS